MHLGAKSTISLFKVYVYKVNIVYKMQEVDINRHAAARATACSRRGKVGDRAPHRRYPAKIHLTMENRSAVLVRASPPARPFVRMIADDSRRPPQPATAARRATSADHSATCGGYVTAPPVLHAFQSIADGIEEQRERRRHAAHHAAREDGQIAEQGRQATVLRTVAKKV